MRDDARPAYEEVWISLRRRRSSVHGARRLRACAALGVSAAAIGPTSQGLQLVVLSAGGDEDAHEFTVERDHDEHLMLLRHRDRGDETVLGTVPHADGSTADLLYRELGRRTRSRVFERAFKLTAKLLDMI